MTDQTLSGPISATIRRPAITARRVITGFVLATIGLGSIVHPWTFYLFVLIVGLGSLYELNRLCEIKGQPLEYPVAIAAVFAYTTLSVFDLLRQWEGVLLACIVIAAFWLGMYGEQKGYFARTAYTLLAVLYIGKLLTYFIFIRQIPSVGPWWTLFAVFVIAFTDMGGMAVGMLAGRTQLTRISPKKTVEGSVGATLIAVAVAVLLSLRPEFRLLWWQAALLGAVTSIAAQAGDLVESALKRDAGVKDTGTVIQGHGGILDRFDSYLFGGVAFFAMLHVLGLPGMQ
jgi:phosphatidate cytidylyltransferase